MEPEERHRRADFDSCRVGHEFGDGGEIEMADNHHSDVGPPVEELGQNRSDRGKVTVVRRGATGETDAEPPIER